MLIYRALSIIFFPFIELYLFYRVYKKKEDKKRLKERFGHPTKPRPQGDVVWLHAVSVGETNSALILIHELLDSIPGISILFTTTTLTSAAIVQSKLAEFKGRLTHQFLPIDSYFCVKSFMQYWRPHMAIFVESEIWPNLVSVANQMDIPTFLVNARMSAKSSSKWSVAKFFGFKIFDYFTGIFAQSLEDQMRLKKLTKQQIFFYGNLKSQAQNLNFDADELTKLKTQIGSRKFWLAASTHKGEEEIILQVHQQLKKDFPDLLTILVLRHPNRAEEVKTLINGVKFAQRSKKENITAATEIYLVDTLNELGIFYRLAKFAFIGGSLAEVGGHNPFEAIKLGCGVISGRHVKNFKEVYEKLEQQNACLMVDSGAQLTEKTKELLQNEKAVQAMTAKALAAIDNSENIATNIVDKIDSMLENGSES